MKKAVLLMLLIVFLSGCFEPENGGTSLLGDWAVSGFKIKVLESYEEGYYTINSTFYPEFDNYLTSPIMHLEEDMMSVYVNYASLPIYGMVGIGIDPVISDDTLFIPLGTFVDSEEVATVKEYLDIDIDTLAFAYTLSGDELTLV